MKNRILGIIALAAAAYIGYSDLHQNDTQVTVTIILIIGVVFGFLLSKKLWLFGFLLGIGVPVAQFIAASRHMLLSETKAGSVTYWPATYEAGLISLIAIPVAIAGVYIGYGIKGLFHPKKVY